MIKKLLAVSAVALSMVSVARADVAYSMPGIEAGFKLNTVDADNATSNKQTTAIQAGGTIVFDLGSNRDFGIKTGLMYSERTFENDFGGLTLKGKISYAEIPLQLMFKFEDYAGIFLGPSFATKLGDDCTYSDGSTCALKNIKSTIIPITFGAQFKMAANFGLSLFFETVSGELADGMKSSRGIGANLLFVFD